MKISGSFALVVASLAISYTSGFINRESGARSAGRSVIIDKSFSLYGVQNQNQREATGEAKEGHSKFLNIALASLFSLSLLSAPFPAHADGQTEKFKLPPVDLSDKNRCKLNSSTIGQANAARDKLYDLRQCKLSGASAPGFDLSGVIMSKTDVSKANFQDAYFSKGYLQGMSYRFHLTIPICVCL
jgi:uncharacterized protein YjbI with pentapeptide repeats